MDNQLTEEIKAYIDADPQERDIMKGAEMVLKLNRNRIFFQNVALKPQKYAEKVLYELKKFYAMRVEQKTLLDVVKMNSEIIPAAASIIADVEADGPVISTDDDSEQTAVIAKGRRTDHEELPDEIKALWDRNGDVFFKLKAVFEELKKMNDAPACDRFEKLKILSELDTTYRDNLAAYDGYKTDEQEFADIPSSDADPADIVKKVNAARTYLSKNKAKLAELKESDPEAFAKLLANVQEKYNYLVGSGNAVGQSQKNELAALGLSI